MRKVSRFSAAALLAAVLALSVPAAGSIKDTAAPVVPVTAETALASLKSVGAATLRVFIWDVYDSELFTLDGTYRGVEPGLALNLRYKRAVTREQLVKATRKEWNKLGISATEQREEWLQSLLELWPDVAVDDEILLYVDAEMTSHFYFNGAKLGALADAGFTEEFLAIWLSPDTSHPKARAKLLNLSSNTTR